MLMRRLFEEMTSAELAADEDLATAVAILPIAAIEQHGAHLPLGTDAIIADHMVQACLPLLPQEMRATFLPTLRIGKSAEHTHFPGTVDHDWQTATTSLIRIGESLSESGFRRLILVSSHGGNTPVMETAALELRRSLAMFVATGSWMRFGYPAEILPELEIAHGIHGGAVETALMLHFRPDLVRTEAIDDFPSLQAELEIGMKKLRAHGRLNFGWMAGDLNPAGTVGDARLATAEMGAAIAAHQAAGFAEMVADVLAFDLARLA
jgi:creatinine amidohydrolase